ncbi:RNA-binding domain-containing protein [Dyadobacter frigoris]|uniref:S1 RNA-binding domain-containing protein n=1 Tax=Dyadobacter frigoris TaxID=2576211 RepID=A0A4V6BJK0_9BACT|nr:RNA-binding domain-containing protein [Dyadobacter frigoris]TKT94153.1 S1 RNA-binding domain-containing protein [Dyadobacter frigoris]
MTDLENNQIVEFKIEKFETKFSKINEQYPLIYVKGEDGDILTVRGFKWQVEALWKYETIYCEVYKDATNGKVWLKNKDSRHPYYEIDNTYKFKVVGEKIVTSSNNKNFNVLLLEGEDGDSYEVNLIYGQKYNALKSTFIQCKVTSITSYVRLSQIDSKDPFFVNFNEIVKDNNLEKKYYKLYFEKNSWSTGDDNQLIEQYYSQRSFWVFTFTNKVLLKKLQEHLSRRDFIQAVEVNNLIIIFEEWILNRGIISSFSDEDFKTSTKLKTKTQLENAYSLKSVLEVLCNNPFNLFEDATLFSSKKNFLERFYYLIFYSSIELISYSAFIERLKEVIENIDDTKPNDLYYAKKILSVIKNKKKVFISDNEREYFRLTSSKDPTVEFSEKEIKYLMYSYGELLLCHKINLRENVNILCGQILKLFTKVTSEISQKEKLLFNSYMFFETYKDHLLNIPFEYDSMLRINHTILSEYVKSKNYQNEHWDELEDIYTEAATFSVQLTQRNKSGYEVKYKGMIGFLPTHNIEDNILKKYQFEDCDFTISAKCISLSKPFNLFIVEQVSDINSRANYKYTKPLIVGNLYDAIITGVENFGIFLLTNAGEGLLHIKELFDKNDILDIARDKSILKKIFPKGQKIKVVLIDISSEKKVSFSFSKLKDIDPLYYHEFLEKATHDIIKDDYGKEEIETDTYFDIAQNEKAFCIEQYAMLQFDLDNKIKNFLIARQLYINTKNARSYLINIFTSYLEILLSIRTTIANRSLNNITNIKNEAKKIASSIDKKTIEVFPDSYKLIFFLDIVSLFNETSEDAQKTLFKYVQQYSSESANKDLKTVAKITLANNLLISESQEDAVFCLKNLRLIFDFLSNGILSLEETIEDKNEKDLKTEILSWRNRIQEEESETLEFKSTFFTPVLDEKLSARLQMLSNLPSSDSIKTEISKINGDLAKKAIIHSCFKSLAAFANSNGGTLLIGVNDNNIITGLEKEYKTLSKKDQNRDGYGKKFDALLRDYFGDSFSSLITRKYLKFEEGDVLIIQVQPSIHEVFLLKNDEGKNQEQLYIRNLSSSKELVGSELAKYVRNKHLKILYSSLESNINKVL